MKTKEEIIKQRYPFYDPNIAQKDIEINAEAVAYLMDEYASQFQPEWISTANKKPENGERVLCNSIYGIQIGWIRVSGDWQFSNGGSQLTLEYWMPLPKQPQPYNPTKS